MLRYSAIDFSRAALCWRAVVDRGVDRPAGDHPEHQREQDEPRQVFGHAIPLRCIAATQAAERAIASSFTGVAAAWARARGMAEDDACQFGRAILHDEARALDALADSLGDAVRAGDRADPRMQRQADRQRARQVGPCRAQDRRDLRLDRDHRDLPPPRRSDPRRPRHGRQGRRRDADFAERRDHRARAGDRPFRSASGSRSSRSPAIRGSMLAEARERRRWSCRTGPRSGRNRSLRPPRRP